ncbi:hypothetical protein [Actinospongicola halichondriae]|uniref:hypothetical protein n=1 Tax=Actinospongicola halichondriae TaxID=3236844 RepID=UPI003D580FAE
MRTRRTGMWCGAFVLVLVAAACSNETDDAERLADELIVETDGALDETQAACVADGLVASFGDDSFQEVLEAAEGTGDSAGDVRIEVIDIFASCDALDAVVLDEESGDEPG